MTRTQDAIFISYATEDNELALWLARRLTSIGYKVWCDQFKLLGGEPYPADIDDAIRNGTFRLLALVSHSSNLKPNPTKERTLGLKLGAERGIKDFVIPLRVDDISSTELNWMVSDITFIDFNNGWRDGFHKLLKKLSTINAPKPVQNGMQLTAEEFIHDESLSATNELLYSNCLRFLKIPEHLQQFQTGEPLTEHELKITEERWPCYPIDDYSVVSFQDPPGSIKEALKITKSSSIEWKKTDLLNNIPVRNIVKNLLVNTLRFKCLEKGLKLNDGGDLYFPKGLLDKDTINYLGYEGNKTHVQVFGERTYKGFDRETLGFVSRKFFYHLSPVFKIRDFSDDELRITLGVRLYIVEPGFELTIRSMNSRRKKVCKFWFNHEWFNRHLAILSFLSEGSDKITAGNSNAEIILSTKMDEFTIPVGINETVLEEEDESTEEDESLEEGDDDDH